MNSQVAAVVIALAGLTMLWYVVTLPSRVLQPIVRDKLLRLLDDIDWRIRDGDLPADDPAVCFLRMSVHTAAVAQRPSAVELVYVIRKRSDFPSLRDVALPSPAQLRPSERSVYHEFERRFRVLTPAFVLVGSWFGLGAMLLHVGLSVRVGQEVRAYRHGRADSRNAPVVPDNIVVSAVDVIGDGRHMPVAIS